MPPQAQDLPDPERPGRSRPDGAMSGRERRRAAAEQAERRKRLLLIGGAVGAALIVALVLILLNRPQAPGSPVLTAEPFPASIPAEGTSMGPPDAAVTVTEWGDFT